LDHISGKTPLILKEISVFPNISGISPSIFKPQLNQHSVLTEPIKKGTIYLYEVSFTLSVIFPSYIFNKP
jgi:hypothetical protein